MVDVLILNYNDYESSAECALRMSCYKIVSRILIVDNKSTDDSFARLKKIASDKILVVLTDKNGGYGYGNNYGIRYLTSKFDSKFILLCNPDTSIDENAVVYLEHFLQENKGYAIVAPFMLNGKGEKQLNTAFRVLTKWQYVFMQSFFISLSFKLFFYKKIKEQKDDVCDVDALSGSLFMMNAEKMLSKGMYDENIFLYGEETVLGMKLKSAGMKSALLTKICFIHNHSVSINKSVKGFVAKRRLQVKSHAYILKTYYKAGFVSMFVAKILFALSYVELFCVQIVKKLK